MSFGTLVLVCPTSTANTFPTVHLASTVNRWLVVCNRTKRIQREKGKH